MTDIVRGIAEAPTLVEPGATTGVQRDSPTPRRKGPDTPASMFVVRFGASVRRDIERECWEINRQAYDQVGFAAETGGYLFSHYRASADGVKVVYATASAVKHTTHSVGLDDPVDVKAAIRNGEHGPLIARAGLRMCGNWHSHGGWADSEPSDADHANWAEHLRLSGQNFFVGLIVAATGEMGWSYPYIHAFRTSWDPAQPWGTRTICEPVRVIE